MLHHCVGNDGAGERYYDRIERRESFIMFCAERRNQKIPITHWRLSRTALCGKTHAV